MPATPGSSGSSRASSPTSGPTARSTTPKTCGALRFRGGERARRFRLDTEAQTARIVRAVSNPYTTILGHLTGRLLLRREGYGVDIEEVLSACAQYGVAVEINANPHRLDLDWRWHRRAVELGCMLSINPDAHSADELDLTRWGVAIARKGGVPKEAVLNGLAQDDFAAFLLSRARHSHTAQVASLSTEPMVLFGSRRAQAEIGTGMAR